MHREIVKQIWYTQLCYGQSVVIKKKKNLHVQTQRDI